MLSNVVLSAPTDEESEAARGNSEGQPDRAGQMEPPAKRLA